MSQNAEPSQQGKPIALLPVGLKEAALDSPTFRACYTHFTEQVDLVEKWLETWMKSVSKVTTEIGPLEGIINGFLSQSVAPLSVSEAVLDHDYTLLAIKRYGDAAREIWTSTILGMKRMEVNMIEPVRGFMQNDLRHFKESRRVLDQTQKVYDGLLYRYYAQNKIKEPSSLREDAFQLHEARKAYLKASMDFSVMAPELRTALDNVLVKVFSDQWRDMRNSRDNLNGSVRRWNKDIERVRCWAREIESGETAFRKELSNARKQIEDGTEARARPSRDLEDYSLSASPSGGSKNARIDPQSDGGEPSKVADRQGWLFLRTLTGKPTRTVWVRRWGFVKNGIFGWLVQGSRSGGVEESDRIGVLLCNVRPAQSEERRFSFEVKTKDSVYVLQAESQADLAAWMETFQKAKQIALENSASMDSPAFAITSPPAPELAADSGLYQTRDDGSTTGLERGSTLAVPGADSGFGLPNRSSTDISGHRRSTGVDRDAESGKDHASRIIQKLDIHRKPIGGSQYSSGPPSSPALAGGGIASLIAASHNVMPVGPPLPPQSPPKDAQANRPGSSRAPYDLPLSNLAPATLANAPAPTNLSTTAVIISGERAINSDTMGLISNIWGSSHVGCLNKLGEGVEKVPTVVLDGKISDSQIQRSGSPPEFIASSTGAATEGKSTSPPTIPSPSHRRTTSLPGAISDLLTPDLPNLQYPQNYPVQLRTQDAQFRLLFPGVNPDETVLLVFRATWSLNEQQEFPGRVYVTSQHMYFYSHHMGLILTSGINLEAVSELTAAPGRDYDLLFVHLKESSKDVPSTRIAIKAFLEPLKSLQKRLEYLVRNCSSAEPSGAETLIERLIKLDQNDSANVPAKDNWEEFTGTATSDDGRGGRSGIHAAVMLESGRDGSRYRTKGATGSSNRIKLPRQPVNFVPSGMDQVVVDRVFDISSKALFHVMFGDRSALWQLLYHERQAQRIKQSAWVRSGNDVLRRDFEYQIDRGNFFGLVTTQAHRDLRLEALDLLDLITDQVRKLGAQSRTKKAIEIFGQVGAQNTSSEFASSDAPINTRARRSIKHRSLASLIIRFLVSAAESFAASVIRFIQSLLGWIWRTLNANAVIMLILAVSAVANMVFTSNSTAQWWKDRQVVNYLGRIGVGTNGLMTKAVYLQDVHEFWAPTWDSEGSENACRATFDAFLSSTELDAPIIPEQARVADRKGSFDRLGRSRRRLGSRRHELLVAMRVINSIEQEMVDAEWEGWLEDENMKCKQVRTLIQQNRTASSAEVGSQRQLGIGSLERTQMLSWHRDYCGSCAQEKELMSAKQVGSVKR
ncbi:MAG: hypothetical protein Q9192_001614 [Flavoplaca navasiana]